MSRDRYGPGGTLQKGIAYVSQVFGKFGWEFEPKIELRDSWGAYARTATVLSSSGLARHNLMITARVMRPPQFWSVTEKAAKVASENGAWLMAYFDHPQEVLVFDPDRYDHEDMRTGEVTYEFFARNGVSLERWLANPNLRVLAGTQRKLS